MPGVPVEQASDITTRQRDISSWHTFDTTRLNSRARKEYDKRKAAVEAYFTSETPVEEIAQQHHISHRTLSRLIRRCLKQHEDGAAWGFRALVPGTTVQDHAGDAGSKRQNDTEPADEEAGEEHTASLSQKPLTGEDTITPDELQEIVQPVEDRAPAPLVVEPPPALVAIAETDILDADMDAADVTAALEDVNEETEKRAVVRFAAPGIDAVVIPETPLPAEDVEIEALADMPVEAEQAEANAPIASKQDAVEEREATPVADEQANKRQEEQEGIVDDDAAEVTSALETTSSVDESAVQEQEIEEEETAPLDVGAQFIAPGGEKEMPELAEAETAPLAEGEQQAISEAAVSETATVVLPAPEDAQVVELPWARSYRTAGRAAVQRRLIQKRKERAVERKLHRKRLWRAASVAAVAALLIVVVMPLSAGLAAYSAYNSVSALAHDGLNSLLNAKSLLHFSKSDPTAALNAANLQHAQGDFQSAEGDFDQLQQLVERQDIQTAVTQFAPQYASKLGMAQRLVQVGLDVSRMGDELAGVGLIAANILHSSPLASNSNKPLVSPADISAVEAAITHALYYISDVQLQMSQVSVNELPVSASQKTQLNSLMVQLPGIESLLTQAQGDVGMVAWLLGIGQPRRFLLQTMDTAELRPGGGFTGDYGVLQIDNGRMSPFTLSDVTLIDYAENGTAIGRSAPPGYSWMNFGNWGVRDSNLSGDFPATARMTMQVFEQEGGGPVDGDIAITPAVIAHVLYATGPIKVPGYNVTVTPQNLEYWIHYYQQNPLAISQEKQISGNYSHTGRKAFTGTVGQMLLSRVRRLPPSKLIGIFKQALKDIQSRDLEIYFTDPTAEGWLAQHGYNGSLSTFSQVDGFAVVQANISISKASQYVHTTLEDDVSLDKSGGATHNLTITLNYQQRGPVYGYDTYADYIRVYAPPNARFLGGDGFDTGHALCTPKGTSSTPPGTTSPAPPPKGGNCAQYNTMFPSGARYCPSGNYSLGERGYLAGKGYTLWPYDALGGPTAYASDLPGRSMWGGLTETPKNCISYISLSWYVPHAVKKVNGQPVYTILVQKQSGVAPTLIVRIDASAVRGLKSFSYNYIIYSDRQFILKPPPKKK